MKDPLEQLGEKLDAMSARTIFKYLGIGMGILLLLGLITPLFY